MTPNEASKVENSPVVWYNIYGAYLSSKYGQPKFKVGQTVRISKYKSTFDKGYLPSYTEVVTHQLQVERRTGKVRHQRLKEHDKKIIKMKRKRKAIMVAFVFVFHCQS